MEKTLGGDRLGAGKRQKVHLHGYGRSTHNLGYLWRSTMSAGTLVPFMSEVALPGDTFDIDLDVDVKTHPTIGPLFGSYKVQVDVFEVPVRLYNSWLHNNKLKVGMNMSQVKLPYVRVAAKVPEEDHPDIDNSQINPSALLSYLGIRGVATSTAGTVVTRDFNAVPLLAYWDIYKNYYSNKQEEIGAMVDTVRPELVVGLITIKVDDLSLSSLAPDPVDMPTGAIIEVTVVSGAYDPSQIYIVMVGGVQVPLNSIATLASSDLGVDTWNYVGENTTALRWRYQNDNDIVEGEIGITTFDLENIDEMRESILAYPGNTAIPVGPGNGLPYNRCAWTGLGGTNFMLGSQQGLGLKTYQSDLFNNWLSTDWIDGPGGITELTAVDTSDGSFTLDTLILARKVYDLLNRVAVSGGTYDDWMEAVWAVETVRRAETPMYMGGLSKELVFQEVVSNSESAEGQPLGTLAGKGVMAKKHKGGHVTIKPREIGYIIGIISLTPRVDYSQGNKWDVHLKTLNDFHKPQLDEIGFQELLTEQMAWWSTSMDEETGAVTTRSAGKQPAWINYMTNVNVVRGNFAIKSNEMWMTLNRRYEPEQLGAGQVQIEDLTTYIDPTKYNQIFAETSLDSQNFWVQIANDMTVRRVMSARVMPNL